jgi:hypothetical protein
MSYENFVTKYHRYQYAPRSLSEAFRDADYGTAIWRCEKPQTWKTDVFIESLLVMLMCGFVGYMLSFYLS